jgi:integrase
MATITKRGAGWFVQVRRKGYTPRYHTVRTKREAEVWGRREEAAIDREEAPSDLRQLRSTTLGSIIRRYIAEVTPRKRSAETERLRLEKLLRHPLCDLTLAEIAPPPIAAYRDERLASVKAGTVRRELSLIRHALDIARREWGFSLAENPLERVTLPILRNRRERRLDAGELARLDAAIGRARNPLLRPIIMFAVETALRRGEILNLEWQHVDTARRTAHIPVTKTGNPRTIPLTDGALAVLQGLTGCDGRVFPITATALRLAWDRACGKAGIANLHFHDLRHESLSRFCELGLTIPELAVISGHRDPRMLFRYAHLRPTDLAQKLAGRSWAAEGHGANPGIQRPISGLLTRDPLSDSA